MQRHVPGSWRLALALALAGVGCADAPIGEDRTPCVAGLSEGCTCDGGKHGASTCQPDGTMSECVCPDGETGGSGKNGGGEGGTGGTSGVPVGGRDGEAGRAGNPAGEGGGGSGGSGGSGGGGMSGEGGGGASGGGGGDAGPDAGGGDKDAGHPQGGKPKPGEPYAPCMSGDDCHGDLECAAPPFATGAQGYCTARCRTNLGMVTGCPAPPSGTVMVVCGALSGLCQLGSCEMADCPEGMKCHEQVVPSLPVERTIYYCAYGD